MRLTVNRGSRQCAGGVVFAANGQELFKAILQAFQFGSTAPRLYVEVLKNCSGGVDASGRG